MNLVLAFVPRLQVIISFFLADSSFQWRPQDDDWWGILFSWKAINIIFSTKKCKTIFRSEKTLVEKGYSYDSSESCSHLSSVNLSDFHCLARKSVQVFRFWNLWMISGHACSSFNWFFSIDKNLDQVSPRGKGAVNMATFLAIMENTTWFWSGCTTGHQKSQHYIWDAIFDLNKLWCSIKSIWQILLKPRDGLIGLCTAHLKCSGMIALASCIVKLHWVWNCNYEQYQFSL